MFFTVPLAASKDRRLLKISMLLFVPSQLIFQLLANIPLALNYLPQILLMAKLIVVSEALDEVNPMGLLDLARLNLPLHPRPN